MQTFLIFLTALFCSTSSFAQLPGTRPTPAIQTLTVQPPVVPPNPDTLVSMTAEATVDVIHPGDRFFIAVSFDIEDLWHIYWSNPGETGNATQVNITAPEGFEIGEPLLPRPEKIPTFFTTYGYEHGVVVFVPIVAPSELAEGDATFEVDAGWLVCLESCYLGDDTKSLKVRTSDNVRISAKDSATVDFQDNRWLIEQKEVAAAFGRIPIDIESVEDVAIAYEDNRIIIEGPIGQFEHIEYFPDNSVGVKTELISTDIARGQFRVVLNVTFDGNTTGETPPVAAGVIALGRAMDDPSYSFVVEVE